MPVLVIGTVPAPVNTRGRLRLSGFPVGKMRLSVVDRFVLLEIGAGSGSSGWLNRPTDEETAHRSGYLYVRVGVTGNSGGSL